MRRKRKDAFYGRIMLIQPQMTGKDLIQMFLLFLGFWILLNGRFTWEILLFGLVIAAAVYWFICRFMDYSLKKDFLL